MVSIQALSTKYCLQVTGYVISQIFKNSVVYPHENKWNIAKKRTSGHDTYFYKSTVLPMLCNGMTDRQYMLYKIMWPGSELFFQSWVALLFWVLKSTTMKNTVKLVTLWVGVCLLYLRKGKLHTRGASNSIKISLWTYQLPAKKYCEVCCFFTQNYHCKV